VQLTQLKLNGRLTPAGASLVDPLAANRRAARICTILDEALGQLASGYGVELVSALGVWLLAFGRDFSLLDRLAPPTDAGTCTSEAAGGWPAYFTPDGLVLWASYPPLEFAHKLVHDILGIQGST